MKTTKTTKKFIPLYTVDLTDLKTPNEITEAFVVARFEAGLGLSNKDQEIFVDALIDTAIDMQDMTNMLCDTANDICTCITTAINSKITETPCVGVVDADYRKVEKEEKKPNIFKRFWNWITRK